MRISNFHTEGLNHPCFNNQNRYHTKNSPNRYSYTKDLCSLLNNNQTYKEDFGTSIFSSVNMNVYNPKDGYKDKKKIKDVVTVKKVNLVRKENIENKKMPQITKYARKASLDFSYKFEHHLPHTQGMPVKLDKTLNTFFNLPSGNKTFVGAMSPIKHNSIKLQKIKQDNDLASSLIQTKPAFAMGKADALIDIKLKAYISSIKEGRIFHGLSEHLQLEPPKKHLKFRVGKGNNSQLVKWLFKKRWWWVIQDQKELKDKTSKVNFIWTQLKEKCFFETENSLPDSDQNAQIYPNQIFAHNHFPQNEYLGNKKALFYNMSRYYKLKNVDIFTKLPLTYHVTSLEDKSWRKFAQKFNSNQQEQISNIWILKPGENSNRGRGITVHTSLEEIKLIICQSSSGEKYEDSKAKDRTYIIQAYIQKPFLYNKRKFDIRSYMLLVNINKTVKGYWYSGGYIRTSSFEFQLNSFDTFVHLTNDAIQTNSASYGKYEQGNKISYAQFQKYLDTKYMGCGYDLEKQIVPQMRQIARDAMKAAVHIVKGQKYDKPVFEVFGLDFMIDRDFKPWLIEINTNPCIETSCLVLQKVIPKMLDDALKLSLDIIFPPPQNWPASRKHCIPSLDNKFELIYDESKEQIIKRNLINISSFGEISEDGETYS